MQDQTNNSNNDMESNHSPHTDDTNNHSIDNPSIPTTSSSFDYQLNHYHHNHHHHHHNQHHLVPSPTLNGNLDLDQYDEESLFYNHNDFLDSPPSKNFRDFNNNFDSDFVFGEGDVYPQADSPLRFTEESSHLISDTVSKCNSQFDDIEITIDTNDHLDFPINFKTMDDDLTDLRHCATSSVSLDRFGTFDTHDDVIGHAVEGQDSVSFTTSTVTSHSNFERGDGLDLNLSGDFHDLDETWGEDINVEMDDKQDGYSFSAPEVLLHTTGTCNTTTASNGTRDFNKTRQDVCYPDYKVDIAGFSHDFLEDGFDQMEYPYDQDCQNSFQTARHVTNNSILDERNPSEEIVIQEDFSVTPTNTMHSNFNAFSSSSSATRHYEHVSLSYLRIQTPSTDMNGNQFSEMTVNEIPSPSATSIGYGPRAASSGCDSISTNGPNHYNSQSNSHSIDHNSWISFQNMLQSYPNTGFNPSLDDPQLPPRRRHHSLQEMSTFTPTTLNTHLTSSLYVHQTDNTLTSSLSVNPTDNMLTSSVSVHQTDNMPTSSFPPQLYDMQTSPITPRELFSDTPWRSTCPDVPKLTASHFTPIDKDTNSDNMDDNNDTIDDPACIISSLITTSQAASRQTNTRPFTARCQSATPITVNHHPHHQLMPVFASHSTVIEDSSLLTNHHKENIQVHLHTGCTSNSDETITGNFVNENIVYAEINTIQPELFLQQAGVCRDTSIEFQRQLDDVTGNEPLPSAVVPDVDTIHRQLSTLYQNTGYQNDKHINAKDVNTKDINTINLTVNENDTPTQPPEHSISSDVIDVKPDPAPTPDAETNNLDLSDDERPDDPALEKAYQECMRTGKQTHLIKEELRRKIIYKRCILGLDDIHPTSSPGPSSECQLSREEVMKKKRRQELNRIAAAKARQKRKSNEEEQMSVLMAEEVRNDGLVAEVELLERQKEQLLVMMSQRGVSVPN